MELTKYYKQWQLKRKEISKSWDNLISLLKKVKVTTSFLNKLEKELEYLEFQREVELKQQELLKSKTSWKRLRDSFDKGG